MYKCAGSEAGATAPHDARITIKSMEIRMPIVEYESNYEAKLNLGILKQPKLFLNMCTSVQKIVRG